MENFIEWFNVNFMDYSGIELSTKLVTEHGTLDFPYPVISSAGILNTPEAISKTSFLGGGVSKSIGERPRPGYRGPIGVKAPFLVREEYVGEEQLPIDTDTGFPYVPVGFANAIGLTNPGYEVYVKELKKRNPLPLTSHGNVVPWIISIFANTPEILALIAYHLSPFANALELNLSCPNTEEDEQIDAIGKSPRLVRRYVSTVRKAVPDAIIIPKLPPLLTDVSDESPFSSKRPISVDLVKEVAYAAKEGGASAISVINTYPITPIHPDGEPILFRGSGGLSGPLIYPLALEMVRIIHKTVDLPIIGIGGVSEAHQILKMIDAGASIVGMGTAFLDMDTQRRREYLIRVYEQLGRLLQKEGCNSLKEYIERVRS